MTVGVLHLEVVPFLLVTMNIGSMQKWVQLLMVELHSYILWKPKQKSICTFGLLPHILSHLLFKIEAISVLTFTIFTLGSPNIPKVLPSVYLSTIL